MTRLQILTDLDHAGTLKHMILLGMLPWHWHRNYEIYLEVDKELRTTRKLKSQVVSEIADKFRMTDRNIYKVLKFFENESRGTDTNQGG